MMGILEHVVRKRFGEPRVFPSVPLVEYRWNEEVETLRCILYKSTATRDEGESDLSILHQVYGDAVGGSLLRGALKVSMLQAPKPFGLYQIEELQDNPHVRYANSRDPGISFFMDSANVWYYGLKNDELYVYDSETDEINSLGPIESALEQLFVEWGKAKV